MDVATDVLKIGLEMLKTFTAPPVPMGVWTITQHKTNIRTGVLFTVTLCVTFTKTKHFAMHLFNSEFCQC